MMRLGHLFSKEDAEDECMKRDICVRTWLVVPHTIINHNK